MTQKTITITGGNGFVGLMLQAGLRERGYEVVAFDKMQGPVVNFLRRRHLGTSKGLFAGVTAMALRRASRLTEQGLVLTGAIRPSLDDILAPRSLLAARFRGSHAVIHLAGFPHPNVPGATEADFRRLNYEGSVNVFEAAREAGVPKFVFASSAQVYGINKPVRIDQFPILESNYCPTAADKQSVYGLLKWEFERYLERECRQGDIQSVALRMEFPGVCSRFPWNFYISTSIENTVAGFAAAIESDLNDGFDAFNLADAYVDKNIVDIQKFLNRMWPQVRNCTTGNECLLSTEKARSRLGYNPSADGTYFSLGAMW
jgi:nucleoside-diphosphate-sugar epimerase